MRLTNSTDISDDLILRVFRFVCPSGVHIRRLDVLPTEPRWRRPYRGVWRGADRRHIRIWIGSTSFPYRVAEGVRRKQMGYLQQTVYDRTELLVQILAHETRHDWQSRGPHRKRRWVPGSWPWGTKIGKFVRVESHWITVSPAPAEGFVPIREAILQWKRSFDYLHNLPRPGSVHGAKKRYSERDADAYSIRMVRRWRRHHRSPPYWGAANPI